MERLALEETTLEGCIEQAVHVLESEGVVLYPTDTLYGLGADAFSDEAVDRVYEIKGRDERKPIHCIVADLAMAEEYAEVTDDARLLFERLMPGGMTLIMKKKVGVGGGIAHGIDTIGIRIPQNDFCVQLARAFGRPYTATSANLAGHEHRRSVDAIVQQLGSSADMIDLIIDAGELPPSAPSTVVDLSREEPVILREGVIPAADVWNAIRAEG